MVVVLAWVLLATASAFASTTPGTASGADAATGAASPAPAPLAEEGATHWQQVVKSNIMHCPPACPLYALQHAMLQACPCGLCQLLSKPQPNC